MKIEICANGFESAKAAQDGGAGRIELCTELSVGGLTPRKEIIKKVLEELDISTHVLIRPRSGDFVYSQKELTQMLDSIAFCKKIGCQGIVSGALTANNDLNIEIIRKLMVASEGMEFTFHRAFDICKEPLQAFENLKQLGITRLLSSGQQAKAIDGIILLKKLKALSEAKIQIMPGSGITKENAINFKNANFEAIHFSGIKKKNNAEIKIFFDTGIEGVSSIDLIRETINSLA